MGTFDLLHKPKDEIWGFVGAKARNATKEGQGDAWCFTAIDRDTKLFLSWVVGERSPDNALALMQDIERRVVNRPQITTDGHGMYPNAVAEAFNYKTKGVDFAQIVKQYGQSPDFAKQQSHRRYSPAVCTGVEKIAVFGKPDMSLVSTSYVERTNLHIRMNVRRMTRLTNGFSKKIENHTAALSLHFFVTNFIRPHGTLSKEFGRPTTPAMAAGITSHPWKMEELLELMRPDRLLQ